MSAIQIRPMARGDLAALFEIFTEVVAGGDTYAQDSVSSPGELEGYWSGRGGQQWVAESDGRILGGYTVRANHPGRGSHVGTASYLVASTARGRGIGRLLGEHSIERARAIGFAALQFNFVVSTNTPAVRLWESLGFRTLARLPGAFDHAQLGRVDALVMFREL